MKLSFPGMLFLLLGYILCFSDISSFNNHFVDAETLQNFTSFEMEEQLKVIDEHAAKIIKTTHGDTYECVDYYKQPAFDDQTMKNHLLHYKMHQISSRKNSRTRKINDKKFGFLWENGVGCPIGTIPIQRVTKDKLLRLNSYSNKSKPQGSWNFTYNQYNVDNEQHHFAVARTKRGEKKSYSGVSMAISVHDPEVRSPQFSSSRMHVQIGDDFIQVGWIVNPALYTDMQPRSFVYTKAGKNQCYNSLCPAGIILVRSDIPFGGIRGPPGVRGSTQIVYDTYGLLKDKANGNWWLEFGGIQIGFWPAKIFQQSLANSVEWGGEVYSASLPGPRMGNGYFPLLDPEDDAHVCNITLVDENFKIDKMVKNVETFSDNNHSYKVYEDLDSGLPVGHIIYFGGPGKM
ncbi:Neprosin [Arabidopsis thaliana x Arabidopsis arenosa]|uniref:Neprosin n=1 Tax=Arabidopsis thaliana x Arabidopsis arenosa TaxID=1240361 RepID=A0A8T1Y948_9BRAS|nr:Neprosin [Arabidopsis thaliana x Arabidopsis arenosa]